MQSCGLSWSITLHPKGSREWETARRRLEQRAAQTDGMFVKYPYMG